MRWYKIAESMAELRQVMGSPCQVKVAGRELCIAIAPNQQAYACAAKCPHAGGLMAQGWVDPLGNIVCPLHRYKFSLKNGNNTSGEGYFLKTYPVKEDEDGLWVGLTP